MRSTLAAVDPAGIWIVYRVGMHAAAFDDPMMTRTTKLTARAKLTITWGEVALPSVYDVAERLALTTAKRREHSTMRCSAPVATMYPKEVETARSPTRATVLVVAPLF